MGKKCQESGQAAEARRKRQRGGVSGRLVVLSVYGLALLMAGILFWIGKKEKRRWDHIAIPGLAGDTLTVAGADSLRNLVAAWPREWVQLSRVSDTLGERFAVVVPCFNETPSLTLLPGDSATGTRPAWICPFCELADTVGLESLRMPHAAPLNASLRDQPAGYALKLRGDSLPWIWLPEGAVVLQTPVHRLLGPALGQVRGQDTAWFLPRDSAAKLEVMRAEDENPEGCAPGPEGENPSEGEIPDESSSSTSSAN